MTNNKTIDAIAKAIRAAMMYPGTWEETDEGARNVWRDTARAALAAVPVGEEVESVAAELTAFNHWRRTPAVVAHMPTRFGLGETLDKAASLLRSLSASLAAVTAERDKVVKSMTEAYDLLAAKLDNATAERDEALDRIEELEADAERVSAEFERDCWKALRSLLAKCHFEWDGDAQLEGVSAEEAREHISTTLAECDRAAERFKAERDEAIRQRDQAVEALARLHERYVLVVGNEGPEAMEARRIVTLAAIRKETDAKGGEHG
jgi:hypothetical protein